MINFIMPMEGVEGSGQKEIIRKSLFEYAMEGRWEEVMALYKENPWVRWEKLTIDEDVTALHLAVLGCNERVLKRMLCFCV